MQLVLDDHGEDIQLVDALVLRSVRQSRWLGCKWKECITPHDLIKLAEIVQTHLRFIPALQAASHSGIGVQIAQEAITNAALRKLSHNCFGHPQGLNRLRLSSQFQENGKLTGKPTHGP